MNVRWASTARGAVWGGVLLIVAVTPLLVSLTGDDSFREPKLLYFQAVTLSLVAIGGLAFLFDIGTRRAAAAHPFAIGIAAAAVVWTAVVTLLSKKPAVSNQAPFTLFCYAAFFVAVVVFGRPRFLGSIAALLLPVTVTSVYAIAQFIGVRTPPLIEKPIAGTRDHVIALLGNPNYVATFLVLPMVACLAALLAWPRRRFILAVLLVLMLAAVAVTVTVTAFIALGVGLVCFAATAPSRASRAGVGALLILASLALLAFHPARQRAAVLASQLRQRQLDALSSHRLGAFAAASLMFAERPLVGVGPGVFEADYMHYRLKVDELHPEWMQPAKRNFGEVHNDHLQLLTEGGIPAYLLFLAFLGRIASMSFRPTVSDDGPARFVRIFAFPAAATFFVLALGQFPMQLTASAVIALYLSGLCFACNRHER